MGTESNPYLTIQVKLDDAQMQQVLEQGGRKAEERASVTQKRVQNIIDTGQAQQTVKTAEAIARREQLALAHAQKLEQREQLHLQKLRQQQEAFQQRTANAYKSWSGQIAKNFETIALAAKSYLAVQAAMIAKGANDLVGSFSDEAKALELSVSQYYAYQAAARDAGVQVEKLRIIFTKLQEALQDPSVEQSSVFAALGIDPKNADQLGLMDKLLSGISTGTITTAQLSDIVGTRLVPSFRLLATSISDTNEAMSKYKTPISEADAKRADEYAEAMQRIKLNASGAFVKIEGAFEWFLSGHIQEFTTFLNLLEFTLQKLTAWENRKRQTEVTMGQITAANRPAPYDQVFSRPWTEAYATNAEKAKKSTEDFRKEFQNLLDTMSGSLRFSEEGLHGRGKPFRTLPSQNAFRNFNMENLIGAPAPEGGDSFTNPSALERRAQLIHNSIQTFGQLQSLAQAAYSLQSTYFQNEIQQQEYLMQREQDRWSERAQLLQDAGLQNSVIYRNEARVHEQAVKKMQQQETALKSKAWESEKGGRETGVVMSTAQAIINAMMLPPPFGAIQAAIAAAIGAAQFATVEAQQNPYKGYRTGGWIQGRGYGDNIPFNGSSGEFVSTASNAARNKSALEYMERGGTVNGGGATINVNISTVVGEKEWVRTNLIPQIKKAVRDGYNFN